MATDHVFDQVSVEIVSRGDVLVGDIAIGTTWSSITTAVEAAP
jgi:Flp pilus assembly pilin Flp